MVRDLKPLHSALSEAINSLETFGGADLTQTLARIEGSLQAVTLDGYAAVLAECRAKAEVLGAAALVKRLASQINVVVHALGILLCLPRILRPGEAIDYVSLGAGNTGRAFDLETNQRIAEFKFIRWQGGPESMLLQPFELNTHATAAPVGAASMSDENGACITSLSVKAAGWTSAACMMNMPAHAVAALQSSNFPKPKSIMCLPL